MDQARALDPKLISALIGAGIVALGWLVSGLRSRATERRRRLERMRDVQTAISAEILPYLESLELFDLTNHLDQVVTKMRSDDGYSPVVPTERNDTVFRAVLPEIHVLPEAVIRPVVRYYSQLFAIEALIEDLRSDAFKTMNKAQQEAIFTDYISLKLAALDLGRDCLAAIDQELASGK